LLIAHDIAVTSTWCDVLTEQLNTAGILNHTQGLLGDQEPHGKTSVLAKKGPQAQDHDYLVIKESLGREHAIQSLENRLKQQNQGLGLGFKLQGTVVDKALLGSLAVELATAGSTALAYLLKLADDDVAADCSF